MTTNNITTDKTGLADDYAEPSTFAPAANVQRAAENAALVSTALRESVLLAGTLHGVMTQAVTDARRAAFVHLMATLNLACVLRTLNNQAVRDGVAVLALYKGYKGNPTAQEHAMKLTGGAAIPFTYATARNYIKVLENVQSRMQLEGGMTSAQVVQVLCDHSAALTSGAYDDPMAATESLWAPFLTAGSLREAYLELAPDKPKLSLAATIDQAAAETPAPDDFETVRAMFLSKCGGYFDKLDSYLTDTAPRVKKEDREMVATKLEEAARKLRSMATMPVLPERRSFAAASLGVDGTGLRSAEAGHPNAPATASLNS